MEHKILTGPRGGKYYIDEKGKKVYISKTAKSVRCFKSKESTRQDYRANIRHCCCCGKPLNRSDCEYYDLTDYCPRCALNDGIITSLE